jgi:hypothetical protein
MLRQVITPLAAAALIAAAPAAAQAQDARSSVTVKSPYLAAGLSLLGTVVPTALGVAVGDRNGSIGGWLIAYGVFVGPSTGYFYAGQVGRGMGSAALRFGIVLGAAAGAMGACGGIWGCDDPGAASAIAVVGLAAYAASALYDIARAGAAAQAWNARHAERRIAVTPRIDPAGRSGGVRVSIAF